MKELMSVHPPTEPADMGSSLSSGFASAFVPELVWDLVDCRGLPPIQPHPLPLPLPLVQAPHKQLQEAQVQEQAQSLVLAYPFDEEHLQHPGAPGSRHRMRCPLPFGSPGYSLELDLRGKR